MMQKDNKSLEGGLLLTYAQSADLVGAKFPLWFNAERRESAKCLELIGLPDKKDEKYALTNVKALVGEGRELIASCVGGAEQSDLPIDTYLISVNNGRVEQGLEVLDNGVAYGSLSAAVVDYEAVVKANFNSVADVKVSSMAALNHLFMCDGAFVYVPKGVTVDKPIEIDCTYGAVNEAKALGFARTLIVLEQGAKASVVVRHRGAIEQSDTLSNHLRETILGADAELNLSELVFVEGQDKLMLENCMAQGKNSDSKVVFVCGGSSHVRLGYTVELRECQSNTDIKGLYLVGQDQLTDININLNHLVEDCTSQELIKGLGASNGVGSFAGRIYVAPNAQRTAAGQQSNNLMLSDSARIYSKPQLEIYADDVKCNHGATVGQLNDDAIYYMRQRGIEESDARKLQLSGFVNDVVSNLESQDLASFVYGEVAQKIDQL